ncbi:hypothetical protein VTI74DRAFT_3395 [Chaetomium olivicolor]
MASSDSGSEEGAKPPSAQDNPDSALTAPPADNNRFIPLTAEAMRLYWALSGPLNTSVWVMAEPFYNPDAPLEPYIREGSGAGASELHPVSQAPLTEPKITSATVSVDVLDEWEMLWVEMHDRHWDGPGEDWEPHEKVVRYGTLPGREPEYEGFPGREHLLRCCGIDRPLNKAATLVVEANGEFLTVHDFVSAVHPWLLGLREDILAASGCLLDDKPLPQDTKLMVYYPEPRSLLVVDEETWKVRRKEHPLFSLLASMS